jgi:PAT family beta-lactamase induction signal transducer AmpG
LTAPPHRFAVPATAAILYFSQGLPYGFVTETLNLYASAQKISLTSIGILSTVGFAWTLKVFWAPLVDLVGTYRTWIYGALVAIAVLMASFSVVPAGTAAFFVLAALLAVASATQDIAIDALTIRITPPDLLGLVNSARVTAYRVAIIGLGSGIGLLQDRAGWPMAFILTATVPLVILALIAVAVPRESEAVAVRHENPVRGLITWMDRPGSLMLLVVILFYRVGDSALNPMIRPFWIARGFTAYEVAQVTTSLGMLCTIAGAIAGGAFVTRFGIFRSLLWLGLAQMLSNVVYAGVAFSVGARPSLYGAAVVEAFTGGLGIAAFLSFLMYVCDKENAATEYAALSAVFALSRTIAGAFSGYFAQKMGFGPYFLVTAALALPGLALLPLIRQRVRGAAPTVVLEP